MQIGNGSSPTVLGGDRALLVAQLGRSWQEPGWFIKPKVQLHARQYQFDQAIGNGQSNLGLAVPTLSLDSGLQFEREARFFGRDLVQTLEPRLYTRARPGASRATCRATTARRSTSAWRRSTCPTPMPATTASPTSMR